MHSGSSKGLRISRGDEMDRWERFKKVVSLVLPFRVYLGLSEVEVELVVRIFQKQHVIYLFLSVIIETFSRSIIT